MSEIMPELVLFIAKSLISVIAIAIVLIIFFSLFAKNKSYHRAKLSIKHLNRQHQANKKLLLNTTLNKSEFKTYLKHEKQQAKNLAAANRQKNIYVLNFDGDLRASAVNSLREEISAILSVAHPQDEVIVKVESAGGMVHAYGLAAAQLIRLRHHNITLTVSIDKIAASGGYMMAAVANKIIAAPFAIIGSIGVVMQLPNFNRYLKNKNIDFELHTAGNFKRTLTMLGENTEEAREKVRQELQDIHHHFKQLINQYRPHLDMEKIATGEHWIGQHAITLGLIDEVNTSDEYLNQQLPHAQLFEIKYETKKSFLARLMTANTTDLAPALPAYLENTDVHNLIYRYTGDSC